MALSTYGINNALTGATAKMGFLNLFSSVEFAATTETAIGASLINMTGAKAKGYVNGAAVMIRSLTASVTGLVELRPYYVVGETTNGFELANEEGGTAIKVAGHALETGTKFDLMTELSGGSNARVSTTWGTAKNGEQSDTAAEAIKVPAGKEVTYAGWFEKSSGGSGATGLQSLVKLEAAESFTLEGEYKVTADKLERSPLAA